MSFTSIFKNFGHAIAAGSKYFATGVKDVVLFATKAQVLQPEVDLLVNLLAGPGAQKAADLGFYALGSIAHALEPLGQDQADAIAAKGLNIQLDAKTIEDVRALVAQIKVLLAARGTPAPAA